MTAPNLEGKRFNTMTDDIDHVEATVQRMAEMHAEHARDASGLQRLAAMATGVIGRPSVLITTVALEGGWIVWNIAARRVGMAVFDKPPFEYLNLVVSAFALNATILILATQRRDDIAARRRAQLTLQLAALSEQKIAKVIALLEEQRRENPSLSNRTDRLAEEMASATDPKHVLSRIIDTHDEAEST